MSSELFPERRVLVIVLGLKGAGKTTLGQRLSRQFDFNLVDVDEDDFNDESQVWERVRTHLETSHGADVLVGYLLTTNQTEELIGFLKIDQHRRDLIILVELGNITRSVCERRLLNGDFARGFNDPALGLIYSHHELFQLRHPDVMHFLGRELSPVPVCLVAKASVTPTRVYKWVARRLRRIAKSPAHFS